MPKAVEKGCLERINAGTCNTSMVFSKLIPYYTHTRLNSNRNLTEKSMFSK